MQAVGLTIAVAVADLDEAVTTYRALLGASEPERASSPADGVEVATFCVGDGRLQLVASTDDSSVIAHHLAEHGPGLHHFGLLVSNVDDAVEHLQAVGARTLGQPRPGAEGRPVVFLHPKSAHGALIELLDVGRAHERE